MSEYRLRDLQDKMRDTEIVLAHRDDVRNGAKLVWHPGLGRAFRVHRYELHNHSEAKTFTTLEEAFIYFLGLE